MVSHHEVVQDFTEAGLRRMVGAFAISLPCAALLHVLANVHDYRQPAVAIAVWLAMFAAGGWLVPRLRSGGLGQGETVAAAAIAVGAVVTVGAVHSRSYPPGSVDLAILGTVWLLALVALSRPARVWIPCALTVFVAHGALLIRGTGVNPLSLAQVTVAGYILASALTACAALRPTLAVQTAMTARRASLAGRSAAERAAAAAVLQERRGRLAVLEVEALPLLRGIADGTLDLAVGPVREQRARQAAVLRHSLTDRVPGGGEAVAGLEPVLRAAAARGVLVTVQVIGDLGTPEPPVARVILATLDAVISALPPHQVALTVLASGDDVELYLTFSEPPRAIPDLARFGQDLPAAARGQASVDIGEDGSGFLEISWWKGGPA
jgi:hypothetical protein